MNTIFFVITGTLLAIAFIKVVIEIAGEMVDAIIEYTDNKRWEKEEREQSEKKYKTRNPMKYVAVMYTTSKKGLDFNDGK